MAETLTPERALQTKRSFRVRAMDFAREFFSVRLTRFGVVVVILVILCAAFAEVISPYDPNEQDYSVLSVPPSREYLLGTDPLGRDVLSRIVYGTRISLQVGFIAMVLAVGVGLPIGLLAGFVGGRLDNILMRIVDAIQAFPSLILALGITAALGPSKGNAMIAIGFVSVPVFARLARGETLALRETDFVAAARVLGFSTWKIILSHILPNGSGPIIVQATLRIATAIITEASLSYLGVGVQPPTPSWGTMLRTGTQYLSNTPWLAIAPGFAIFLTVLAINFIGDGLRHALDPRLVARRRG
jgi:peptide/nickel transport system permease protein